MNGQAPATTYEADPAAAPATSYEGRTGTTDAADAPQPSPGRRRFHLPAPILEEYDYLRDLSTRGAQANVVLCRRKADGVEVAVKWYRELVASFDYSTIEELRKMAREHVVPLLDFRQWQGETWEVQEYFPLGSLEDFYKSQPGPQPLHVMRDILAEASMAIAYIHGHPIVHRDLSPSNILVRTLQPLDLVLADFGVARLQAASRVLGSVAGTTAYMSPEASTGVASAAADWWSLGQILYEGVHGKHLFASPAGHGLLSDPQIRVALNQVSYELAPSPDPRWDLLLRGLLTHDQSQRWGATQITAWLRGESPPVHERLVTTPIAAQPYRFRGDNKTPADLARAFRLASEEAAQLLANPRNTDHLRAWLARAGLADACTIIFDPNPTPGAAVVALQAVLDPTQPPAFADRVMSSVGLREVARQAVDGDASAGQWITRLRQERILTAWADVTVDGGPIGRADDRLQRWWSRIDASPQPWRTALATSDPAAEGLLLQAAVTDKAQQDLDRGNSKELRDLSDLPAAFLPIARAAAEDPDDSNFGIRALAAARVPLERRLEQARLKTERTAQRAEQASRRHANRARLRASLWTNLKAGAVTWFWVGLIPGILAFATVMQQGPDAATALKQSLPWLAGFSLLGGALRALRAQNHARLWLLGAGVALVWWAPRLLADMGPDPSYDYYMTASVWQSLFLALGTAGVVAWASTFIPGFAPSDHLSSGKAGRLFTLTGVGLGVLWLLTLVATFREYFPTALTQSVADYPLWYAQGLESIESWTAPLTSAQPSGFLPYGALVLLAVGGAARCAVARFPVSQRHRQVTLGLLAAALLLVVVSNVALLAAPLMVFGIAALVIGAGLLVLWIVLAGMSG